MPRSYNWQSLASFFVGKPVHRGKGKVGAELVCIGLAKNFLWAFHMMLQKNPMNFVTNSNQLPLPQAN